MPLRRPGKSLALVLAVACGSSSSAPSDAGGGLPDAAPAPDGASGVTGDAAATDGTASEAGAADGSAAADGAAGNCPAALASAPPVTLASFDDGIIPSSDTMPEGFRGSDVTSGTLIHPGAGGTAAAAQFDYQSSSAVFFQGMARPQYLDGSSTYHPDLANAVEFDVRLPAGSALVSASAGTLGFWTYHWLHGDPWVGTNSTGGNLTDSQMHGYSNLRIAPSAAGAWQHVTLSTSAFAQSRGNYHFYAARAVAQDQSFFGTLRQFELVALQTVGTPSTLDLDGLSLVTLPPTATVCPAFAARAVSASAGDVAVPVQVVNGTTQTRTYRVFVSSEIGLDRQTLEVAMHDTDSVASVDDLQGGVGADGGLGAVELFAADASGRPSGASIVPSGNEVTIPPGGVFSAVIVHHIKPAMLGPMQSIVTGGRTYAVRRNTLTTSVIVWDPSTPPVGSTSVAFTGSNADSSHPAPPGFPAYVPPPAGWGSADVPIDQVGGYFVSSITLTP